jgi:hypothetical protein
MSKICKHQKVDLALKRTISNFLKVLLYNTFKKLLGSGCSTKRRNFGIE